MGKSLEELQDIAKRTPREIVVVTGAAKSGHPGGSLSAVGIAVEPRVARVAADSHPCPMEFGGIYDTYAESGQPDELLDKRGLIARGMVAAVRKVLGLER